MSEDPKKAKGIIFGKFLPFHLGHKHVVDEAVKHLKQNYEDWELTVYFCYDYTHRYRWHWEKLIGDQCEALNNSAEYDGVVTFVTHLSYSSKDFNQKESSKILSKKWLKLLDAKKITNKEDTFIFFGSEDYIKYLAALRPNLKGVIVDKDRKAFTISGTDLREDIFKHWEYLPDVIKSVFSLNFHILGVEGSGKSSFCEFLYAHFGKEISSLVSEFGATQVVDSNKQPSLALLEYIIDETLQLHERALKERSPINIFDTNMFTTLSYVEFYHGTSERRSMLLKYNVKYRELFSSRRYHHNQTRYFVIVNNFDHPGSLTPDRLSLGGRKLLQGNLINLLNNYVPASSMYMSKTTDSFPVDISTGNNIAYLKYLQDVV